MRLEGSCQCGAVTFRVDSPHPYPYQRCYCSVCRKTRGAAAMPSISGRFRQPAGHGRQHNRSTSPAEGPEEPAPIAARPSVHFCGRCAAPSGSTTPTGRSWSTPSPRPSIRPCRYRRNSTRIMLEFKPDWGGGGGRRGGSAARPLPRGKHRRVARQAGAGGWASRGRVMGEAAIGADERILCREDEIAEGAARGFPAAPGSFTGLFAVRKAGRVVVYVNSCPLSACRWNPCRTGSSTPARPTSSAPCMAPASGSRMASAPPAPASARRWKRCRCGSWTGWWWCRRMPDRDPCRSPVCSACVARLGREAGLPVELSASAAAGLTRRKAPWANSPADKTARGETQNVRRPPDCRAAGDRRQALVTAEQHRAMTAAAASDPDGFWSSRPAASPG